MKVKKGPWTILSYKTVYKNPWIDVREDQVIRPDGKPGIFGVVIMKSGISVLPLDDKGNVYLTEEYHYAVERVTTEVISGGIDKNETKLDAAKRELEEEAGITAKEWTYLGFIDPFTSAISSPNYMFLARNLRFSKSNPDGTESIKIIKIRLEKAIKMAEDSEITHGASVVLILKANSYLA